MEANKLGDYLLKETIRKQAMKSISANYPLNNEMLNKYPSELDWEEVSDNDNISWTVAMIDRWKNILNWKVFSQTSNEAILTPEILEKFKDQWDWGELSGNQSLKLTFDLIDPFIIKMFLGGIYEVHPFAYRKDNVLKEFKYDELIRIPWSLTIPYKKFRHPLEGVNIGFKKKDIMGFGAYGLKGHSFGEWSMDQNLCLDWYLNEYATGNQVY